jgi:hypothetical protein
MRTNSGRMGAVIYLAQAVILDLASEKTWDINRFK